MGLLVRFVNITFKLSLDPKSITPVSTKTPLRLQAVKMPAHQGGISTEIPIENASVSYGSRIIEFNK